MVLHTCWSLYCLSEPHPELKDHTLSASAQKVPHRVVGRDVLNVVRSSKAKPGQRVLVVSKKNSGKMNTFPSSRTCTNSMVLWNPCPSIQSQHHWLGSGLQDSKPTNKNGKARQAYSLVFSIKLLAQAKPSTSFVHPFSVFPYHTGLIQSISQQFWKVLPLKRIVGQRSWPAAEIHSITIISWQSPSDSMLDGRVTEVKNNIYLAFSLPRVYLCSHNTLERLRYLGKWHIMSLLQVRT